MGAPVATFSDNMFELNYEVSDREIYNDIRSEIEESTEEDVTNQLTRTVYSDTFYYTQNTAYRNVGVSITSGDGNISLQTAFIEWHSIATGNWFNTYSGVPLVAPQLYMQDETMLYFHVFNGTGYPNSSADGYRITVTYAYQTVDRQTFRRKLMVRAYDSTSAEYYGRRVMNLQWPLGQTEAQMQSLVEAYLERYKDPYPQFNIKLLGKNTTLIPEILTRKISERINLVNTNLGMDRDFFINSVDIDHEAASLPNASYMVEAVRSYEENTIFTLDTSVLDGTAILGW